MYQGINVDPINPLGRPDPDQLLCMGFGWVRMVSRPGAEEYAASCRRLGLRVLAAAEGEAGAS